MSLKENGIAIGHEGPAFVPADLIAKLSGINLATVRTIIAAIDAIESATDVSHAALTDVERLPLALPDAKRSDATRAAYEHVQANVSRLNPLGMQYIRLAATA